MGLRLHEGIDTARFARRTGHADRRTRWMRTPSTMAVEAGYVVQPPGRLIATEEGRLRLDALLPRLVR